MKNSVIILVLVAAIAAFGVWVYTLSQNSSNSDSMMKKDETVAPANTQDSMEKKSETVMEKVEDQKMSDSRYVEFSTSTLESSSANRRVLFFYASWCPTCKPADLSFAQNTNKIPEDVTIIRVNYNDSDTDQEEKDLAKKYGITYQHTFVQIDSVGKEVAKWNGGQINELLSKIK